MISLTAFAAMPEVQAYSSVPPVLVPAPRRARLLIVDDEPMITAQLESVFTSLGYIVESFTDPFDARHRFQAVPDTFDLVISDLAMPGLDGCAFARQVLALRPKLPVLIYTGYLTEAAACRLHELGVRRILSKPSSLSVVTQAVAQQIAA